MLTVFAVYKNDGSPVPQGFGDPNVSAEETTTFMTTKETENGESDTSSMDLSSSDSVSTEAKQPPYSLEIFHFF